MQLISPVAELLEQWLLLPLFADLGMIVLLLRSVRNRAGYALSALLALFAFGNLFAVWPDSPGAAAFDVASASMLPAMVAVFVMSYAGGRKLAARRRFLVLLFLLPAVLFAAWAVEAGWSADTPVVPLYSLVFFGCNIGFLLLSGAARSLTKEEPLYFAGALTMIMISGPVFHLILPAMGLQLAIFPYTSAGAGALFAMATLRYKSFFMTPVAESGPSGQKSPPAGIFIAGPEDGKRARAIFGQAVRRGVPGVVVTRTHPVALRRETGLAKTPVIWLAQSSYEKCLPPASVDVLSHAIRDLGEPRAGCILLVEDLDYLVTNAGLFPTLDMLGEVRHQAERTSMTVLLSSELLTDEERREIRDLGIRPLPRPVAAHPPA